MAGTKVYCATSEKVEDYFEKGFKQLPEEVTGSEVILYKEVKIPKDSVIAKNLIKVYEDPAWQKVAFSGKPFEEWIMTEMGQYYAGIGLNWERISKGDGLNKKIVLMADDEKVSDTLTTWRLEILMSDADKLLRLAPCDFSFPNPLYPVDWIYAYIKDEIKGLGKLVKVKSIKE